MQIKYTQYPRGRGQGGGHGWWDERANVESVIGEQEGVGGYELMQPNDVTIEYCSAGRRVGGGGASSEQSVYAR